MNENKKVVTTLDAGLATPIAINKEDATNYAKAQEKMNNNNNSSTLVNSEINNNIVQPTNVNNINPESFHYVNDVIKVTKKKKTPLITYVIMIAVLVVLVAIFIIFELPLLRGL